MEAAAHGTAKAAHKMRRIDEVTYVRISHSEGMIFLGHLPLELLGNHGPLTTPMIPQKSKIEFLKGHGREGTDWTGADFTSIFGIRKRFSLLFNVNFSSSRRKTTVNSRFVLGSLPLKKVVL